MFCVHCGQNIPDDSSFCIYCGNTLADSTPTAPATPAEPQVRQRKPKNSKKLLPLLIVGGVVIVAAVVLLFVLLGGGTTPKDAMNNLIDNGNFTVELKAMGNKMEIQVDIDWKKQDVTVYAESGGEFMFAIYDGYYITEGYYGYYAEDYSDEIDAFFEGYENADESDWESVADLVYSLARVDVEDYVDLDEFGDCMDTFLDKLENKSWLKKNAGYSTKRKDGVKLHIYEPNLYKLATASLSIFEKCFEDEDDYEYVLDMLDDYEDELEDYEISLTLGVKGKYLVNAEAEVMGVKVKVSFSDIDKTKIDTGDLKDMLDDAEIW